MLEAKSLSKSYGDVLALNDLNLSVNSGETYILLGANGAGKSTTIRLFLGFVEPSSGSAFVNNLKVDETPLETKARSVVRRAFCIGLVESQATIAQICPYRPTTRSTITKRCCIMNRFKSGGHID